MTAASEAMAAAAEGHRQKAVETSMPEDSFQPWQAMMTAELVTMITAAMTAAAAAADVMTDNDMSAATAAAAGRQQVCSGPATPASAARNVTGLLICRCFDRRLRKETNAL